MPNDSPSVDEQSDTGNEDNSSESDSGSTTNVRNYVPNNGKLGHEDYPNAETVIYDAPYKAGDACPDKNCNGKLQDVKPNVELKIVGQSFAKALKHVLNKCRCNM